MSDFSYLYKITADCSARARSMIDAPFIEQVVAALWYEAQVVMKRPRQSPTEFIASMDRLKAAIKATLVKADFSPATLDADLSAAVAELWRELQSSHSV